MTIEEIYYSEDISVRSFNVCNDNRLKDLSSILSYFQENKTFDNLRNCGRKSNEELIALCLKYIRKENLAEGESTKIENSLIAKISNLTRTQREIINSFIEVNVNNLTNRSKNAISAFLNGNLKIRNLSENILVNERFSIQDIKNVGEKSITELKNFIDLIKDFVEKVSNSKDENEIISIKNRFFIEKKFSISEIPSEILDSLSIFKLTDFLIGCNAVFENNQNMIFQKAFKIYRNQPELTLNEIAEELNLSRERVRQIRKSISENLFAVLQFVRHIDDDLFQKYRLDQNQQLINVDEELNNLINQINNTNFSIEFNSILIYSYIPDRFELLGNIEDVFHSKTFNSRGRHNWGNFYLISRDVTNLFDFNSFVNDLAERLNSRIEETYSFHFKSYLSNFMKVDDSYIVSLVLPLAEMIINKEFDLIIDLNDNIIFKRNTVKQVPEFAIEALEKLGVPSNIEEIYKLIEKDFPEITKSKESLRGSLQRTPEIIYFGRSSTYGLKKWETEKEGIKGGTIKDIILDYLEDKNCPIHILELVNEVHRYREETSAKNIITNLKLDPQNQFIIFNQSFVGLNCKSYNSKLCNLPKFLGKTITHHIKKNNRINRIYVEEYFSKQLGISLENIKYIIEHLIENDFIQIDNQDNLII